MTTIITFADLYREDPVVLAAKWSEFVLLFNAENDEIRVRQTWDPVADPADFVLKVAVDWKFGEKGWMVRQHKDSPATMVLPHKFVKNPETPLTNPNFQEWMASGGLLHFIYRPYYNRGAIGMMLHWKDDQGREEEPAHEGQFKKPSLENLPAEIHRMLLGRLSVYETLHVLPYVSMRVLNVVKAGGDWKQVDFFRPTFRSGVSFIPSSSDMLTFAELSRETCTTLKVVFPRSDMLRRYPSWNHLPHAFTTLCWKVQWPCVTELHLQGDLDVLDPYALRVGLRRGNFPALTVLKLFLSEGVSWDVLDGCPMPSLTHLEISIDGSSSLRIQGKKEFCDQFRSLQTLCVFVKGKTSPRPMRDFVLFPRPRPADEGFEFLPNLKNLTIGGGSLTARDLDFFQQHMEVFRDGANVTRLCLCDQACILYKRHWVIPGHWLFSMFPHLSAVYFDHGIKLDWHSIPDSRLQNLVHIRVTETGPPGNIPFHRMVNLEAACIFFFGERSDVSLESVSRLPRSLVMLKITSELSSFPLEAVLPVRPECNIRSLEVDEFGSFDDDGPAEEELKLYKLLPKLNRLVMPRLDDAGDIYIHHRTANEVCTVLEELTDLVEVTVPDFDSDQICAFQSNFPDHSWDITAKMHGSGNVCSRVFRDRRVKEALGEELFVFEDPFFWLDPHLSLTLIV